MTKCIPSDTLGTWTAYYDQAFKVELENNMMFFANFKYVLKPNITADLAHADSKYLEDVLTDDDT